MRLARTADLRAFLTALIFAICLFAPASAGAAISNGSFEFDGPGAKKPGREVNLSVKIANTATDKSKVPELIDRIKMSSDSLRFNGDANGLKVCAAKAKTDGTATNCPKASKVGRGTLTGLLGEPGEPADSFGALSSVSGKFTLFNYKHSPGTPARLLAVITTKRPFAGIAINLIVPISGDHDITVDVPVLAELPPLIKNSYPPDTKLVLSKLTATIAAPRSRNSKPFLWLSTTRDFSMSFKAFGG